jgi:hypothetical protein
MRIWWWIVPCWLHLEAYDSNAKWSFDTSNNGLWRGFTLLWTAISGFVFLLLAFGVWVVVTLACWQVWTDAFQEVGEWEAEEAAPMQMADVVKEYFEKQGTVVETCRQEEVKAENSKQKAVQNEHSAGKRRAGRRHISRSGQSHSR